MKLVADSNAFAVAMDVDAAGLPFLKNLTPKAGSKTVDELRQFENQSIGINNAIIFSIPQTSSGEDDKGKGSIWLTDSNGYVYQLTSPIN